MAEEKINAGMDAAAKDADKELHTLPAEAVTYVANWWQKHYMKAGHKRLARLLFSYIKAGG
ncbi:hypothetical protein MUP59_01785 [Candidatus Bathyarchaeota archaeon]|nr:hypothetical protein [Candidatus Bathyarchaeota archaeon]